MGRRTRKSNNDLGIYMWVFIAIIVIVFIILICCCCDTINKFGNVPTVVDNCNIMVMAPPSPPPHKLKSTNKYIVFQIDCGGLNNIRMQFETLTVLAWLTKRTIVLPPPSKWYLMGDTNIEPGDIFDLECWGSHIPVLKYDEWLHKLGKNVNVNYNEFIRNIEKGVYGQVYEPSWSPGKTKFKKSFIKENSDPIWYFYCDRKEEFRNLDHRMLGNTECYFQTLSENQKREMRKLIWESIRYKTHFYHSASQIMKKLNMIPGKYNAVHVRNWEGSRPQYKTRSQEEIIDRILELPKDKPILLLSQDVLKNVPERIKAKMDKLFNEYKLIRPTQNHKQYEQSVIEMLLAVGAAKFLGSPSSTYSTGIMQLRGYYHRFCDKIDDSPYFIDGKITDYLKCSPPDKGGWDFDKTSMHKTKDFYRNY